MVVPLGLLQNTWEKANDVMCCFEQILEAAPYKTAAVQLLISYLANHPWNAEYCCRSKDKLISNILLWTPTYGHTSINWPAKTYIHRFCVDTGYHLENLPKAMANRDRWCEKVKGIPTVGMLWWSLNSIWPSFIIDVFFFTFIKKI